MAEVPGYGTVFEYGDQGDGSSTTWTAIARIVDIEGAEETVDNIETTAFDSPGKAKQFQPGLVDNGEIKLTTRFLAARYSTLRGFKGVAKDYRITFNDSISSHGSRIVYAAAYINKIGPKTPLDKVAEAEITIKVSGEPTFTAAA